MANTKDSWEELWGTINYLIEKKGNVTVWDITKVGTWAEDESEIVIRVKLYEPRRSE